MRHGDMLLSLNEILHDEVTLTLNEIYPLSYLQMKGIDKEDISDLEIEISYENQEFKAVFVTSEFKDSQCTIYFNHQSARSIKLKFNHDINKSVELNVYMGKGFYALKEEEYSNAFERDQQWVGGDGIFSLNLKGNDSPMAKDAKTLFVFGDTFVGTVDEKTKNRLAPHLMLNNTFAVMNGKNIDSLQFLINQTKEKAFVSYLEPETNYSKDGSFASFLTHETYQNDLEGYLSTYNPQELTIEFDFIKIYELGKVNVWNYNKQANVLYENRGIKKIKISYSQDLKNWTEFEQGKFFELKKGNECTSIPLNIKARYIRFSGIPVVNEGNFGGVNGHEGLYGLKKVRFITSDNQELLDVRTNASSEFYEKTKRNWYWMQDGIVLSQHVYYLPLIVAPDETKPEGYKFKIEGVSLIKMPIENEMVNFKKTQQFDTPLFYQDDKKEIIYGAGILTNTNLNNPISSDDYVYIYGYIQQDFNRGLLVARVKPDDFENMNEWRFYNGKTWVTNMLESKPLLDHISCEMSVSPIYSGENKGKFIAVYQYDVTSNYVAYSIGETPYGPFTDSQIVYYCEESLKDKRIYTYNAKAHPHLSTEDELLVTYNVNTTSDPLNESDGTIYHPRWIKLINTTR